MDIASYIDHTLLKPDATSKMIEKLCFEAIEYGFYSVCVNPIWVPFATEMLQEKNPVVCSVVAFPLGATPLADAEAKWAVSKGAGEIDMVLPIGLLKQEANDAVFKAINQVVLSVPKIPVKVILETCLLTDAEKITACELSVKAGAAFVKTSTGFASGGATLADIKLMRKTVGSSIGVKASGGIRTYELAAEMIKAGASRIGTSSGIQIVNESK